jgi:hypothetical protein
MVHLQMMAKESYTLEEQLIEERKTQDNLLEE